MSWDTDEQVRKLAHVLQREMGSFLAHAPAHPDRFWTIPARAMLAAVGPMIAAQAWQEGYWDGRRSTGEGEDGPRYVNPYSEKEAGR